MRNAQTPLELALVAWTRAALDDGDQTSIDDAVALGETGVFSKRQIALICDLPLKRVNDLVEKPDKRGGRLNPEHLHMIHDLALSFARGGRDRALCRTIVGAQTSAHMVSRLTGIPLTTVERWTKSPDLPTTEGEQS